MDEVEKTFGKVISRYTRAQAIQDRVLIDVSHMAWEAGIRFPVAVTVGVWNQCVKVPDEVKGQDEDGRLWDVVWMFRMVVRVLRPGSQKDAVIFRFHVRNDNNEGIPPLVKLKATCTPGDGGEPVITILLPDED